MVDLVRAESVCMSVCTFSASSEWWNMSSLISEGRSLYDCSLLRLIGGACSSMKGGVSRGVCGLLEGIVNNGCCLLLTCFSHEFQIMYE